MYYREIVEEFPLLREYAERMPSHLDGHFVIKDYDAHQLIHQKNTKLERIGILLSGSFRVINELENGNVFMIEENQAISFVGEVALLAGASVTSVTIETVTPSRIAFLPLSLFDDWLHEDIVLLRKLSEHVARKLYCASYSRGERQFYSTKYILLKYILGNAIAQGDHWILNKTRQIICEEVGITVKTINRTLAHFQEEGLVSMRKGKVVLTQDQRRNAEEALSSLMKQSRNGN